MSGVSHLYPILDSQELFSVNHLVDAQTPPSQYPSLGLPPPSYEEATSGRVPIISFSQPLLQSDLYTLPTAPPPPTEADLLKRINPRTYEVIDSREKLIDTATARIKSALNHAQQQQKKESLIALQSKAQTLLNHIPGTEQYEQKAKNLGANDGFLAWLKKTPEQRQAVRDLVSLQEEFDKRQAELNPPESKFFEQRVWNYVQAVPQTLARFIGYAKPIQPASIHTEMANNAKNLIEKLSGKIAKVERNLSMAISTAPAEQHNHMNTLENISYDPTDKRPIPAQSQDLQIMQGLIKQVLSGTLDTLSFQDYKTAMAHLKQIESNQLGKPNRIYKGTVIVFNAIKDQIEQYMVQRHVHETSLPVIQSKKLYEWNGDKGRYSHLLGIRDAIGGIKDTFLNLTSILTSNNNNSQSMSMIQKLTNMAADIGLTLGSFTQAAGCTQALAYFQKSKKPNEEIPSLLSGLLNQTSLFYETNRKLHRVSGDIFKREGEETLFEKAKGAAQSTMRYFSGKLDPQLVVRADYNDSLETLNTALPKLAKGVEQILLGTPYDNHLLTVVEQNKKVLTELYTNELNS